ncbi:MAG: hypothetical protein JNK05_23405 [Myxococcales bacterium]|nr:hypothetical protein [Myxococcales bacterium]
MRRSPLDVLRRIALLSPLAAAATISGCARTNTQPDPRPGVTPNAEGCPATAPTAGSPCDPSLGSQCNYRAVATSCRCTQASQWECMTLHPTRGPLPPPELDA